MADLKERFSIIKDLAGIDLKKAIVSISRYAHGITVTWNSFDNMKYAEIVDYCLRDTTDKEIHHTFEVGNADGH